MRILKAFLSLLLSLFLQWVSVLMPRKEIETTHLISYRWCLVRPSGPFLEDSGLDMLEVGWMEPGVWFYLNPKP